MDNNLNNLSSFVIIYLPSYYYINSSSTNNSIDRRLARISTREEDLTRLKLLQAFTSRSAGRLFYSHYFLETLIRVLTIRALSPLTLLHKPLGPSPLRLIARKPHRPNDVIADADSKLVSP